MNKRVSFFIPSIANWPPREFRKALFPLNIFFTVAHIDTTSWSTSNTSPSQLCSLITFPIWFASVEPVWKITTKWCGCNNSQTAQKFSSNFAINHCGWVVLQDLGILQNNKLATVVWNNSLDWNKQNIHLRGAHFGGIQQSNN